MKIATCSKNYLLSDNTIYSPCKYSRLRARSNPDEIIFGIVLCKLGVRAKSELVYLELWISFCL